MSTAEKVGKGILRPMGQAAPEGGGLQACQDPHLLQQLQQQVVARLLVAQLLWDGLAAAPVLGQGVHQPVQITGLEQVLLG